MRKHGIFALIVGLAGLAGLATWASTNARIAGSLGDANGELAAAAMGDGLVMPSYNPSRGRLLFARKGCMVCHSVNGVGGEDAPPLDAATMPLPMNPFDFAAKMWRGADAMIYLQREELGEQIELNGEELADIVAFIHDEEEQQIFSMDDVPASIRNLMLHMDDESLDHEEHEEGEHDPVS